MEDSDADEGGLDSPNEEMASQNSSGAESPASCGDDEQSDEDQVDGCVGNPGWADAMRKILGTKKPKRKKSIVLSKAKRLSEVVTKAVEELLGFEVEGEDGAVKKATTTLKMKKVEESETKEAEQRRRMRRESLGVRVKPSLLDRERERKLQKIATNGVVQLFNAVKQQQQHIEERLAEAGPVERKREKALKNIDRRAFLDMLMGATNKLAVENDEKEAAKEEEEEENEEEVAENEEEVAENRNGDKKGEKVWSVLRDNFVMGANLKDWDKRNGSEEDSSEAEEMDSSD